MRAALRWSRTLLVSLLLWAATGPTLGEAALPSPVVFVEVAPQAAPIVSVVRRAQSRQRARRSPFRAAKPMLRSHPYRATPCSPVLLSAPAIYLRNCVLQR